MNFLLPENITYVLNTLNSAGFKAYIVGGCVRDILLNKQPHDFDITTSAKPQEVENLFDNVIKTGVQHGTVTVLYNGEPIEVTTFRTEGNYTDLRRPDSVDFVDDVRLDLSRRDFTVNAMCYSQEQGLIDCFGGIDDIKHKVLKAVGDPQKRFSEDALRILRLFRFSSTLLFAIERNTLDAAIKCADGLKKVSAERIAREIKKAVLGDNICALIPLLQTNALSDYGLSCGDFGGVSKLPKEENLRLFAFLNLASCDCVKTAEKLKLSREFANYCTAFKQILATDFEENLSFVIKVLLADFGTDTLLGAIEYKQKIKCENCENLRNEIGRILNTKEPYKLSHLNISGSDILALGIAGERVGKTLNILLDKVRLDPALNSKQTLLKTAQEISSN